VESAHKLDVNVLEPVPPRSNSRLGSRGLDLRVSGSLDKVEAGVNAVVDDLLTVDAVFLLEIRVVTRLDVLENRPPAIAV
jgi:hypothetical protein